MGFLDVCDYGVAAEAMWVVAKVEAGSTLSLPDCLFLSAEEINDETAYRELLSV